MPPQAQSVPTYNFPGLGSVQGLRAPDGSRYATETEARQWLMQKRGEHLTSLTKMTPEQRSQASQYPVRDAGVIGGFSKRASDFFGGILPASDLGDPAAALAHSSINPVNVATGLGRAEKKLGKQTAQHARDVFTQGATTGERAASVGKMAVSALSMLDPFATQTVGDVNELQEQGRSSEAKGAGVFDIFTLLPGSGLLREARGRLGSTPPEFTPQVNRLTRATGSDPVVVAKVADDLNVAARAKGRPNTVASLKDTITEAKSAKESEFNRLAAPYNNTPLIATDIVNGLTEEMNSPDLVQLEQSGDAEATSIRNELNNQIIKWSRPYTLEAMNKMRSRESAGRAAYYKMSGEKQGSKLRSDIDAKVDSIVENGLKNAVYGFLKSKYPNIDVAGLKAKQSALITLESEAADTAKTLRTEQAGYKGSTPIEKGIGGAYAHPSGKKIGVAIRLHNLLSGGPEAGANKAVRKAFPSAGRRIVAGAAKTIGRAAQLSPRDQQKRNQESSLRRQLKVAQSAKNKEWEQRIRRRMEAEHIIDEE